jgi:hypothetical protein
MSDSLDTLFRKASATLEGAEVTLKAMKKALDSEYDRGYKQACEDWGIKPGM